MKFVTTKLPGVMIIEPEVFKDSRGFFFEVFQTKKFQEAGMNLEFLQDNHSRSCKDTLRGLHLQFTEPQGKYVRVLVGKIWDVVVDVRVGSPTFKQWISVELDDKNFRGIYVPPGYAHGFVTLSESADVEYKVTEHLYNKADEGGVRYDDPSIGIKWPVKNPILSPKDEALPKLDSIVDRLSRSPAYSA